MGGELFITSLQHFLSRAISQITYVHAACSVAQSYPTLCGPMDCSPPGSSVHGIRQARMLVWVAMPSSRGSSQPRGRTCISFISCIGRQVLITRATWETQLLYPRYYILIALSPYLCTKLKREKQKPRRLKRGSSDSGQEPVRVPGTQS